MKLIQRVHKFPEECRSHLQILGASKVTLGKSHAEDPQLGSDLRMP